LEIKMDLSGFLAAQYFGNTLKAWLSSIFIALAVYIVVNIFRRLLIKNFSRLAEKTDNQLDNNIADVISQTKMMFIFIEAVFFGTLFLSIPPNLIQWTRRIALVALLIQSGFWATKLCEGLVKQHVNKNIKNIFNLVTKVLIWILISLWGLENLGVEVSAFIASLGITGIVVGLALQNILGDVFSAVSITIDKPFEVGDYIVFNEYMGTVEKLGWKSTRIRSLNGEIIVIGNSDLLSNRIQNYQHLQRRRIAFTFGVTYQTSYDQLKQISRIIGDFVSSLDDVTFERVHLKHLSDSSIDFEVVYYVEKPDYIVFMDTQQLINFELIKRFDQLGIDFAYPTTTIHLISNKANTN